MFSNIANYIKVGIKESPLLSWSFMSMRRIQDCVVKCIDEYLLRSNSWRSEGKTKLLLSSIYPHKEITSSTVSKWIEDILVLPGVIKFWGFIAHSTRSAATSKTFFWTDILCRVLGQMDLRGKMFFKKILFLTKKNVLGKSFWL